jgi:phage portal protein BeeE
MNRLLNMTELSMFIWGKSFWAVERGESGSGIPKEIWWMKSDRVKVLVDELRYIKGFTYEPVQGGTPIEFGPNEVVWFRYPNPLDEFDGLSLILAARLAADMGISAMKSNKNMFDNGFQMGGLITPGKGMEWTPEQAIEMEERMDRRFKGVDKAHRWGVMRTELEMKIGGVSPKDADWLGGLNLSLEEVARAGKIPLDMVGDRDLTGERGASDQAFWLDMPAGSILSPTSSPILLYSSKKWDGEIGSIIAWCLLCGMKPIKFRRQMGH